MIAAIHQPNYLPYLGFFDKIYKSDIFVLLDNVQYSKESWMNRVKIKTPNGWQWLSVPILTKGKLDQLILEAEINNKIDWRKKHWKTLVTNYNKAPFFNYYSGYFELLYQREWIRLIDINLDVLKFILSDIGLSHKLVRASEFQVSGSGTDLLIAICKALNADTYLSGDGAGGYQEEEKFDMNGIKLTFQNFQHPIYNQLYGDFIPGLSIIDLLFNHGPEGIEILRRGQHHE